MLTTQDHNTTIQTSLVFPILSGVNAPHYVDGMFSIGKLFEKHATIFINLYLF